MGLKPKGYFIVFEGAEGSGKSTQIQLLAAHLRRRGRCVVILREPGGTRVSERIRTILLDKRLREMCPETELLLYLAARAQIVREKIRPLLKRGQIVLCDRFEDSTLAYQGYGRGFSVRDIRSVSRRFVRGRLAPDMTFVLDIHPSRGMKRGGRHDRMERESLVFHQRVRRGFLALARQGAGGRYVVLDTARKKEEVARDIRKAVDRVVR